MTEDERAIRDLVETWSTASRSGDLETVLGLMTDDAIFMVPGAEPFGKQAFADASKAMQNARIGAQHAVSHRSPRTASGSKNCADRHLP